MAWTAYQVTLRLLSPVHVGWRKLGNLQQTRPYVTGCTLWGAFTARLTRELGGSDHNDYATIGNQVDQQLAFTYFYPSTSIDPEAVELWPWLDQWDKFAWTFLGSYASTALENGHSAEAGSLHETEFIAPYTRKDMIEVEPKPVYLVGYIFQKEDYSIGCNWQNVLDTLQLGGERSYGWGRLQLKDLKLLEDEKCLGYELNSKGDRPFLIALQDTQLLAHTIADEEDTANVSNGRGVAIEPLLGRETKANTGFGRSISKPMICWVPGGKVNQAEKFQIQEKGIWKRVYP
jgi:hypothetical protein